MATRTIVTCDLCKAEIKPGERLINFSATRYHSEYPYGRDGSNIVAKFGMQQFCSDACVINAVRGLLNGSV